MYRKQDLSRKCSAWKDFILQIDMLVETVEFVGMGEQVELHGLVEVAEIAELVQWWLKLLNVEMVDMVEMVEMVEGAEIVEMTEVVVLVELVEMLKLVELDKLVELGALS